MACNPRQSTILARYALEGAWIFGFPGGEAETCMDIGLQGSSESMLDQTADVAVTEILVSDLALAFTAQRKRIGV